ncbi:MAG: hypothetical protein ACM3ZC_12360, partial [Bacteroidota bacterium]
AARFGAPRPGFRCRPNPPFRLELLAPEAASHVEEVVAGAPGALATILAKDWPSAIQADGWGLFKIFIPGAGRMPSHAASIVRMRSPPSASWTIEGLKRPEGAEPH